MLPAELQTRILHACLALNDPMMLARIRCMRKEWRSAVNKHVFRVTMHAAAALDGGHRDDCKAGAKALRTLLQPSRVYTCKKCGQPKKGHVCGVPVLDRPRSLPASKVRDEGEEFDVLRAAGLSYGLHSVVYVHNTVTRAHDSIASWVSLAMLSACPDGKESRLTRSAVRDYVWRTFDLSKNTPLGTA